MGALLHIYLIFDSFKQTNQQNGRKYGREEEWVAKVNPYSLPVFHSSSHVMKFNVSHTDPQ